MVSVDISDFFERHDRVVEVCLADVRGSSPREAGTRMFVAPDALNGTIGGGQLEYMAIDEARAMLKRGDRAGEMDVPLGPEIGQCCGGRVRITLIEMDQAAKDIAKTRARADEQALPHVYVLGAGHVGRALADLFQHMPVKCVLIDQRAEELGLSHANVETRLTPLPEVDIAQAPKRSAFVVLTHDHALDFLLSSAALERNDAAYVGLIGSKTKRAKFKSWCKNQCDGLSIDTLICPIGAGGSRDKRPSVIAAQVVAEVITALTSEPAETSAPPGASEPPTQGDPLVRQKTIRKDHV
ncbi:xanthine dehydrogenase accessory factor [Shimia gijangensis]|uniref:Xanthine dehydrogenase accessory factor n=1 Tax=Shimia gijangensis TaxID=1470563 RepID=A0A1M6GEQ2_9RHOB|nr:xanthine dehydrogenase accessory protein XdhC [Shimia gijangensis]SHJ08430.1 xanthine dehydrogenase accessory factor [Shimia gijangensis]